MRSLRPLSRLAALSLPVILLSVQEDPNVDLVPPLRLIEEMKIGSVADPALGFSRAFGTIAIDRDGQIFAYEPQDYQLRVYGKDGKLLRTIGRRGDGPGEFQSLSRFGVVGDTVWVLANRGANLQVTLFDRMGKLLYTGAGGEVNVPLYTQVGVVRPAYMRADGKFTGDMGLFRPARDPAAVAASAGIKQNDTVPYPRVVFDNKGAVPLDTLGWDRRYPPDAPTEYIAIEATPRHPLPRPVTDSPLRIVYPDGRVIVSRTRPTTANESTFRVARVSLAGDTIYSKVYRYRPVRYTAAMIDSVASRSAEFPSGITLVIRDGVSSVPPKFGNKAAATALIKEKMAFPAFQTPVQGSFMGEDGSVWLKREDDAAATFRWVILDPRGFPRGRVDIPANVSLSWSRGDTLWAFRPDADDVPWLVRYRVSR